MSKGAISSCSSIDCTELARDPPLHNPNLRTLAARIWRLPTCCDAAFKRSSHAADEMRAAANAASPLRVQQRSQPRNCHGLESKAPSTGSPRYCGELRQGKENPDTCASMHVHMVTTSPGFAIDCACPATCRQGRNSSRLHSLTAWRSWRRFCQGRQPLKSISSP